MGAMISILLLIARQAQVSVEAEVSEYAESAEKSDLDALPATLADNSGNELPPNDNILPELPQLAELEEVVRVAKQAEWRVEQLQIVREEKRRLLQDARIAASFSMSQRNEALEKIQRLRENLIQIQQADELRSPESIREEIASQKREIERLRQELAAAENTLKEKEGSFAILPHTGPNGTRRYPLYIECRADGAWIMPENIRLTTKDFEGTLSIENPLESALLAKREYLRRMGAFQETPQKEQEPYPLIIVRPDGIDYLYMVRNALLSWKSEYGYELAERDLPIVYPPNDAAMARSVAQALETARKRQAQIASVAPTLRSGGARGGGGVVYRPTTAGGIPIAVEKDSRLAQALQNSRSYPRSGGLAAPPNSTPAASTPAAPRTGSNVRLNDSAPHGDLMPVDPNAVAAWNDVSQWRAVSPGEALPAAGSNALASNAAGSNAPASDAAQSSQPGPQCGAQQPDAAQCSESQCIANQDGDGWALPGYHPSHTALSRSIVVECRPDRFILPPVSAEGPEEILIFDSRAAARTLAAAISQRTRQWGEAGRGMYWRPVLRVQVANGAEEQFETLRVLLDRSGLEVEKIGATP